MKKIELLNLLKELNFPKDEYYVLSGASLVLRGIKEEANDLDLCISAKLFNQIKDKFNLTDERKNECGFYKINDNLEIVVDKKEDFKMEIGEKYNLNITIDKVFKADTLHTVANTIARKTKIPCMQIEIAKKYRDIEQFNNIKIMLNFLGEYLRNILVGGQNE